MDTGLKITTEGFGKLEADLLRLGADVSDLHDVMADVASKGARLAASFAPRRTGNLARSVRASVVKGAGVVRVGSAKVPYAGPINYGWPKRNIQGAHFMERASEGIRFHLARDVDRAIKKMIAEKGLA